MLSRSAAEYVIQPEISSRVRPHPKQYPVFISIEQTRIQGEGTVLMGIFGLNVERRVYYMPSGFNKPQLLRNGAFAQPIQANLRSK